MVSSRRKQQAKLENNQPWWCVSIRRNLFRSRSVERDDNPARYRNQPNHRHYLYFLAIALAAPANAETIGGVSATAAPTATSSGSVTNQAVMIAPSQHLTNSYGNGIQCQGPILTITPYVNRSKSWQLPFEDTISLFGMILGYSVILDPSYMRCQRERANAIRTTGVADFRCK